jgi:hypothetical protein
MARLLPPENPGEALQIKNVVELSFLRAGGRAGRREEYERVSNASQGLKKRDRFRSDLACCSDQDLRIRVAGAKLASLQP